MYDSEYDVLVRVNGLWVPQCLAESADFDCEDDCIDWADFEMGGD